MARRSDPSRIALSASPSLRSRPFFPRPLHGARPDRHDTHRDPRRARRVVRSGMQAEVAIPRRHRAREVRLPDRGPSAGAFSLPLRAASLPLSALPLPSSPFFPVLAPSPDISALLLLFLALLGAPR